jgi:hypothetical protein
MSGYATLHSSKIHLFKISSKLLFCLKIERHNDVIVFREGVPNFIRPLSSPRLKSGAMNESLIQQLHVAYIIHYTLPD